MRTVRIIVVDNPTGKHETESCDELLVRRREIQSVQNIASRPPFPNPLGTLISAEMVVQALRQECRVGYQDFIQDRSRD
jgi:hypothetical protein